MAHSGINYASNKDEDFALSPSEKALRVQFLSPDNQQYMYQNTKKLVNKDISYGRVVDFMYETFTNSLSKAPQTVVYLNNLCINAIRVRTTLNTKAIIRTRDRGIKKANIPQNVLPRPSFSNQNDSNDKILEIPIFRR